MRKLIISIVVIMVKNSNDFKFPSGSLSFAQIAFSQLHHHQTSAASSPPNFRNGEQCREGKKFAIYFLILHRLKATASIHSCWNKIRFKKYLNLRWIIPKVYIRNHHSKWYRHEFADLIFVFSFSSLIHTTAKKKSWARRGKWITEQW